MKIEKHYEYQNDLKLNIEVSYNKENENANEILNNLFLNKPFTLDLKEIIYIIKAIYQNNDENIYISILNGQELSFLVEMHKSQEKNICSSGVRAEVRNRHKKREQPGCSLFLIPHTGR